MVTIAALLKRYGLVMSLPSIFLSDDRGFKFFFKMWSHVLGLEDVLAEMKKR